MNDFIYCIKCVLIRHLDLHRHWQSRRIILTKEIIYFTKSEQNPSSIFDSIPLAEVKSIEQISDSSNEKHMVSTTVVHNRLEGICFIAIPKGRSELKLSPVALQDT